MNVDILNYTSADLTWQLLQNISKHLSSRRSCRRSKYKLIIGEQFIDVAQSNLSQYCGTTGMIFYPEIKVYPNIHIRKPEQSVDIITHIIEDHMYDELYLGRDDKNNLIINTDKLVSGVYEYQFSLFYKQRRWARTQ